MNSTRGASHDEPRDVYFENVGGAVFAAVAPPLNAHARIPVCGVEGAIKYREDIVEGLEQAPEALLRLFDGRNFGKLLVRVSTDPTQAGRS